MSDASLLMLLDEVRGKTLRVLNGVSARQAMWTPAGLQNSILWHAGHCYIVVEWLTMQAIGQQPIARDGWFEMFSWQSEPAKVLRDNWPELEEVARELVSQHGRLRSLIGELTPSQLDDVLRDGTGRTVRYCILHGLHDEASHTGEIWLLRKMLSAVPT